jgi:hypothetical protein
MWWHWTGDYVWTAEVTFQKNPNSARDRTLYQLLTCGNSTGRFQGQSGHIDGEGRIACPCLEVNSDRPFDAINADLSKITGSMVLLCIQPSCPQSIRVTQLRAIWRADLNQLYHSVPRNPNPTHIALQCKACTWLTGWGILVTEVEPPSSVTRLRNRNILGELLKPKVKYRPKVLNDVRYTLCYKLARFQLRITLT